MTVTFLASLPQPAFDAKQVQQNEAQVAQQQDIRMYDLMEHAGAAAFSVLQQEFASLRKIIVICGKGNNGGDGYILARLAQHAGLKVTVFVLAEKEAIVGDASTALKLAKQAGVDISFHPNISSCLHFIENTKTEVIVDSIFGIGFSGVLAEPMQQLIEKINANVAKKFSIDVPSGLCANTGHVDSVAVQANVTVSFIATKKGLLTGQAPNHVGKLVLADLHLGQRFAQSVIASAEVQTEYNLPKLAPRKVSAHKGDIGLLIAIGSNNGMPGAIRMSAEAALRCGASLVSVACHADNHGLVIAGRPELMLAPSNAEQLLLFPRLAKAKALIIGPGLGQDAWALAHFNLAMSLTQPLVVDADALVLLSKAQYKKDNWVLTPHPGEAAKLLGCDIETIEQDRFGAVKKIASQYGGICILKGAGSLISDGKSVWINTSGNSGMASGGMGDVLSGIIAALIVQMPNIYAAARLAVFIHGQAADIIAKQNGSRGILASDLFLPLQQLVNRDSNE
ncbi:NAD(P)H-hydrate dehydratase [Thalassotalea sp. PLHSN55]|uniref:NAD(P)H-hydrate dehydratase n=1 Tax=Thalassotalea sp. PLHSN55 TaxID=3435888 RepID=UPI003F85FFEF